MHIDQFSLFVGQKSTELALLTKWQDEVKVLFIELVFIFEQFKGDGVQFDVFLHDSFFLNWKGLFVAIEVPNKCFFDTGKKGPYT